MKKALCVLLSVVMLLSMSVTAFAADTKGAPSQTLPSWLPDDAPAPDPNSEISIVHFYINEDGETIVYDPETEVIPYSTAYGDAGTAAIYWVNRSQIYWGITSYTKGLMTFLVIDLFNHFIHLSYKTFSLISHTVHHSLP